MRHICVQQKRDEANVIGMAWKKRKAETNELNFAPQPQQSQQDQTESLFSRLLSRAQYGADTRRRAVESRFANLTARWPDALDLSNLTRTAIKSAPINERRDDRVFRVSVKWVIGSNISTWWYHMSVHFYYLKNSLKDNI